MIWILKIIYIKELDLSFNKANFFSCYYLLLKINKVNSD